MTTPRSCAIVSRIAALSLTLALGACGGRQSRPTSEGLYPVTFLPLAIRFDNEAREHAHVYLVSEQRQWLLGRVEAGARAILRIPDASLSANPRFMQLAVITGNGVTLQAARDPRAALTVAQPVSSILSQRWSFAQGQLTSLGFRPMAAGVRQQ
jgi:hypothetical protein